MTIQGTKQRCAECGREGHKASTCGRQHDEGVKPPRVPWSLPVPKYVDGELVVEPRSWRTRKHGTPPGTLTEDEVEMYDKSRPTRADLAAIEDSEGAGPCPEAA